MSIRLIVSLCNDCVSNQNEINKLKELIKDYFNDTSNAIDFYVFDYLERIREQLDLIDTDEIDNYINEYNYMFNNMKKMMIEGLYLILSNLRHNIDSKYMNIQDDKFVIESLLSFFIDITKTIIKTTNEDDLDVEDLEDALENKIYRHYYVSIIKSLSIENEQLKQNSA